MSEIAWAAGLFDGEGSVTVCNGRPRLSLKMVDEESVRRFASTVDAGRVYGPYANRAGERDGYPRRPYWLWVAEGPAAREVIAKIEPWLGTVRRDRIAVVFT